MAHWSDKYIGLKYDVEFDCGHLTEKVLEEQFDIDLGLPSRTGENVFALSAQIASEKENYITETDTPKDGDMVLMVHRGRLNHIGVYFEIDGIAYVLHNLKNVGRVVTHRIKDLHRNGLVVEGFYSWNL